MAFIYYVQDSDNKAYNTLSTYIVTSMHEANDKVKYQIAIIDCRHAMTM